MSEGTRILSNIEWKGRIRHLLILIIAILFGLIVSSVAEAQCNCKFTIPAGSAYIYFDGTAKGVLPGDVICVQGGNIGSIQFVNIRGAANNPVIIRNCGGQALIGGPTVNNGIFFNSSRYVHITGTGDSGFTYGLKIIQTSLGSQGLAYAGLSSDIEIDHMEIQKAGYAAIMAKTDPSKNCADVSAVRPNFTLYNVSIHDNYIHESGGEGIYLGDSFYTGTLVFCGSTQYCHEVRGVRIYNNRFENTGRESIQVGSGVSDVEIYNNKIYNYGAGNLNTQNGGVQLGVGTAGRLYNNFIKGGTGPAIAVQGIGGDYVYNNVIVNPGQEAITVNTRPTPLSTDIVNKGYLGGVYVVNNTIVNAASAAIIEYVNGAPGNVLYNNLIVASSTVWDKTYTTTDWKRSNNIVIPLLANAKFVNPGADDYHLSSGSLAIDAGTNVSAYGITSDADRKSRPAGASFDAGAYEFIPSQMPPIVNAGADVTLTLPSNTIMLKGTASDPDGTIATYAWTKQSGPAAILTNVATTSLSLSGLVSGTYVFRLTVMDNSGLTAFDEVTLSVKAAGLPPVVNAGPDKILTLPSNSFSLTATASDPDGTIAAYSWTKQSGPAATMSGTTTITLFASNLLAGTYIFRLTVTDNSAKTGFDDVTVTVNPAIVSTVLYRINAGGDIIADTPINWGADTQLAKSGYLGLSTANYTCGTSVWPGSGNTTGAPDAIFGPNRYNAAHLNVGPMLWNFPVTSGTYEVRLFFAETPYAGGVKTAGARVFSIAMEGNTVLTNYDIYGSVGMGAAKKVFQVMVTDGVLNMNFIPVIGNPQVNGIEIISLSGGSVPGARTNAVAGDENPLPATETTMDAYPNPFHDTINVPFESEQPTVSVSLMDLGGREVHRETQNNVTLLTLDLSAVSMPNGIYILVVKLGGKQFSQRVMRQ